MQKLHVPDQWLKCAEAVYEHYQQNYGRELVLLLESMQWEAAHSVLMERLVCRYILAERGKELRTHLETLAANAKGLRVRQSFLLFLATLLFPVIICNLLT
jgi:hypothetical protein